MKSREAAFRLMVFVVGMQMRAWFSACAKTFVNSGSPSPVPDSCFQPTGKSCITVH